MREKILNAGDITQVINNRSTWSPLRARYTASVVSSLLPRIPAELRRLIELHGSDVETCKQLAPRSSHFKVVADAALI